MTDKITDDDVVLDVLLSVRDEQRSAVSAGLVREIYELQRRHQFEKERDRVLLGTKRAVEAEADRLASEESQQ
jgi:hypothetical protein